MTPCREHELSISLRAAGALDPDEAARLEGHLVMCPACRAEADALGAALGLAKLPPLSEAERRTYESLRDRTLAATRRSARVHSLVRRSAAVLAAVAAAAAMMLAPALLRRAPDAPAGAEEVSWQPDLDTLWNDASVVDFASSALADAGDAAQDVDATETETETDAALAALEL